MSCSVVKATEVIALTCDQDQRKETHGRPCVRAREDLSTPPPRHIKIPAANATDVSKIVLEIK